MYVSPGLTLISSVLAGVAGAYGVEVDESGSLVKTVRVTPVLVVRLSIRTLNPLILGRFAE